jgi:hypothetical protein
MNLRSAPWMTLAHIGIFSCSACDCWREQYLSKGFKNTAVKRRDFMSDCHQCSHSRLGKGLIRVRVLFNGGAHPKKYRDSINNGQVEDKENIPAL